MNDQAKLLQRPRVSRGRKIAAAIAALMVVAALGGGFLLPRPGVAESSDVPPGVYTIRDGKLLYAYHRLTNSDSLFDLKADPGCRQNLSLLRPGETLELRRALSRKMGVSDLAELPFHFSGGPA